MALRNPNPPKAKQRQKAPKGGLTLVINLARRRDRLRTIRGVLRGAVSSWERIDAVDGKLLTWAEASKHLRSKALANAQWAEARDVPTICSKTGSFSPHLTLGAVGCALSHRKAWERLASSDRDWALILEDDVTRVAEELEATLERCVASLPSSWQLCLVGFHESTGQLLPRGQRLRLSELGPDEGQTGLFGYLLRRSAASELLSAHGQVFPLAHQVDVELGTRHWRPMSRFALSPEAVLIHAAKSEEEACDTDVQTLSQDRTKRAHASMQPHMLVL